MAAEPIYRAPLRARERGDVPAGAGADHAVEHGLIGIGDALSDTPPSLDAAVSAQIVAYGEKAGRMLRHFADLPDGTLVWTRTSDGMYHLGRITGPYRYDASPAADSVGIHHTRPARWLQRAFAEHEIPAAVADTFERGGRNLQRTRDHQAESRTAELWSAES